MLVVPSIQQAFLPPGFPILAFLFYTIFASVLIGWIYLRGGQCMLLPVLFHLALLWGVHVLSRDPLPALVWGVSLRTSSLPFRSPSPLLCGGETEAINPTARTSEEAFRLTPAHCIADDARTGCSQKRCVCSTNHGKS